MEKIKPNLKRKQEKENRNTTREIIGQSTSTKKRQRFKITFIFPCYTQRHNTKIKVKAKLSVLDYLTTTDCDLGT